MKIKQEVAHTFIQPTMTHANYDNYCTRRTGIPICVTQMTHIFTKMYKISLKMILLIK